MTITLIGAGNVGFHLGKRLYKKGISIHQVYSRNVDNATALANTIEANATDDLTAITDQSTIYIIAVKDDVVATVVAQLSKNARLKNKLVVHTSGTVSSQVIGKYFANYGVFYPLQTFSKSRKIRFKNIPICIEARNKKARQQLKNLGKRISKSVQLISAEERAILHVAAVIVNNFSNHLFHIGATICQEEKVSFDMLKPLIQETVLKIATQDPYQMQTGPARRGDQATIQKHLKFLEKYPEYTDVYKLLTKSIRGLY